MTEDEQSGTLAFLQNFYTGVTLYMPVEAAEQPVAEVASPAPAVVELAAAAPAAAATPAPSVAPPARPPLPSKLPSLAAGPPAAPTASSLPPAVPAPPVVPAPAVASPPAVPARPVAPMPVSPPQAVAPASQQPAAAPAVAPYLLTTFSTLGENAQGVVILVRLPPEQFRKLPRNVFLNKLLQAIKLVMADVVLVNVEGPYPVALQNLRKEIAATHILAFGKNLLDVAVRNTQIYEPVQFPAVGLAYLAGAEVEMVEYDVSLKKRLWGGLQRMFLA
jgi:hypothetical protein